MLISVYMTVKDGLPYIEDAVESVRRQTYINWEMVIVDDGSNYENLNYLKSLESDSRFRIFYTGGIGRAAALNLALSKCQGQLVANLDADDLFHIEKLYRQYEVFHKNPAVDFLFTKSLYAAKFDCLSYGDLAEVPTFEDVTYKLLSKIGINHSSVMMRKGVVESVGGYNPLLRKQIDIDLWYRLANSDVPIYCLNETLSGKRVHNNQSFESNGRLSYLNSAFKMKWKYLHDNHAPVKYRFLAVLSFIYGMLPSDIRLFFKKILSAITPRANRH